MESKYISVKEAAALLEVSRQRVLQRIADGSLKGQKIGSQWIVNASSLPRVHRSRPLSPRMAWALAFAAAGDWTDLGPTERHRTRQRLERLRLARAEERTQLLLAWLASRADVVELEAHPRDLSKIRHDPRLVHTGVSDPRANLSSEADVEAYIDAADVQSFADDHFLDLESAPEKPNVLLRPTKLPISHWTDVPAADADHRGRLAPALLSAADLLERGGAREVRAGHELASSL